MSYSIDEAFAIFINRRSLWKLFHRLKYTQIVLFVYYWLILEHIFQCWRIRVIVKFAVIVIKYTNQNSNWRPIGHIYIYIYIYIYIKISFISIWCHVATILGIAAPWVHLTGSYFNRVWQLKTINHHWQ